MKKSGNTGGNPPSKTQKLSGQITVRLQPEVKEILSEIESRHRIPAAEFVRGLVEAGVAMYKEKGFFSFPIEVHPTKDPSHQLGGQNGMP